MVPGAKVTWAWRDVEWERSCSLAGRDVERERDRLVAVGRELADRPRGLEDEDCWHLMAAKSLSS